MKRSGTGSIIPSIRTILSAASSVRILIRIWWPGSKVSSAKKQGAAREKTGSELPTHVIACVGGGSNAAGAFYHFLDEPDVELIAVEAAGEGVHSGKSAATTQLGKPGVLHGSRSYVMQTEDGQVVEPHSISAGLDYPGIGPLHAHLYASGRATFLSAQTRKLVGGIRADPAGGDHPGVGVGACGCGIGQLQLNEKDRGALFFRKGGQGYGTICGRWRTGYMSRMNEIFGRSGQRC